MRFVQTNDVRCVIFESFLIDKLCVTLVDLYAVNSLRGRQSAWIGLFRVSICQHRFVTVGIFLLPVPKVGTYKTRRGFKDD